MIPDEGQPMSTTVTATNLATRETHTVVECKFCGAEIAWVKSKRTGKSYPAQVVRTHTESLTRMYNLRVAPWEPHTRAICEAEQQRRREGTERIAAEQGKTTGETCAHHDCYEPATQITHLIDPHSREVSEQATHYCDEHAKVIVESNAQAEAAGLAPFWTEPEPIS